MDMAENNRSGQPEHDPLDHLFAAARLDPPVPSGALLSRMLEDAATYQQQEPRTETATARSAGAGLWTALLAIFGGWRTVGGMVTAAATGVWIGFSGVGGITDVAAGYLGATEAFGTVELMPEGDVLAFALDLE